MIARIVILLVLCALAPSALAAEPVTLSVWELPRPEDTSISAQCRRAVIQAFRHAHPHIRLTSPSGIRIPEMSAMDTGPLMAIAGGVSPDVIYVNFRQSDTYIREGFLYPLDEWIARLPPDELDERILPQVRPVVTRPGPGPDPTPHTWMLPFGTFVKTLLWRKDIFQAAGLDPECPPRDWAELLDFARRCTDPDRGTYGLVWSRSTHWSWYFYSLLCSAGARAMEERSPGEWYAAFNSDEGVVAYEFVLNLLQGGWTHPASGRPMEGVVYRDPRGPLLWSQGRIAMMESYLTDDLLIDINPELVGIAPVPAGPTGHRASELNGIMCGIFAGAAKKGRPVLDAAWAYIHFLGSPEAKAITTRVLVENGYGQFANPAQLERLGYTDYLGRIPSAWRDAYREAIANGQPEPYGRNCLMVYTYMSMPAERMLLEGLGRRPGPESRARIREILDEHAARANEKMIGRVPPDTLAFRRKVALAVALAIAAAFAWLLRRVTRLFTPPGAAGAWQFRRYRTAYILALPAIAAIALWQYLPMGWGALMALQDYRLMLPSRWAGLDNFAAVLWEAEFWQSLRASLWYAALSILMGFFAPIALAILLHEIPRGRILFRTLYYLPAVISGLVVMLMWKSFFEPSASGWLNQLITAVPPAGWTATAGAFALALAVAAGFNRRAGHRAAAAGLGVAAGLAGAGALALHLGLDAPLPPQRWLEDPRWAMPCVILPTVWAGLGPGCLIYLAALKTIPEDLYEAAELDGAGFFGKIWHVTLPTLRALIAINFVGAVIHAFRVAEYILAMTGGGPAGATEVLALKIFYDAFVFLRFGFATATAWILGAMLIGFTVYQLQRLARVEFRTADS